MASTLAKRVIRRDGSVSFAELSDEALLEQFLTGTELDSQEAFQALVERHGPMVLGICRHVLNEDHDAEDAFQATFLVLARKGGSIRDRRVLSGWLHEVAYRIAIKSRASSVRRRNLERQGMAMLRPAIEPNNQDRQAAWNELRPVLHEEVNRLPDKYRIPVIMSYLEGKTNEEVAELLQWPVGTVKGRLSRARDMLRTRLTRRGLALSAAFLVTALAEKRVFAEIVPSELVRKTVRLAVASIPRAAVSGSRAVGQCPVPNHDQFHRGAGRKIDGRTYPKLAALGLIFMVLGVFTAALLLGASVAVLGSGGGLSDVRAAVSSFVPISISGAGECH
jgi:RNA polymerase sigma factor (sigma-70 family)